MTESTERSQRKTWWTPIWQVIGGVNLRIKVLGIALAMIGLLGLVLTWQMRVTTRQALTAELEQRGTSIASTLASESVDLIVTDAEIDLEKLLRETVESDEDVRYAFLLDSQSHLIAYSFSDEFLHNVAIDSLIPLNQTYHTELFLPEGETIQDLGAPLPAFGGAGEAHVGMSFQRVEQAILNATRQFLLITGLVSLVGIGLSTTLTWVFTRPLLDLTDAVQRMTRDGLAVQIVPWAEDEIGQLQASFNIMVKDLVSSQRELEDFNQLLLRRNRELSALYAISRIVAGPTRLAEMLELGLKQVVEQTDFAGGWVCMLGDDSSCRMQVVSWRDGLQPFTGLDKCCQCSVCVWAKESPKPLVISPIPQECSLRSFVDGDGHSEEEFCHIAVPLLVRGQPVGLMNLICDNPDSCDASNLELLEAIGQQLGIAIDKETLRGGLLREMISAQEEERKRIARELHDETGQALTSLLVSLRLIERAESMQETQEMASNMREVISLALDNVRDLALELRPSVLDDLGLVPALANFVHGSPERLGLDVDFVTSDLNDERLPLEIETTLYRIAQEALVNIARHAEADHVTVHLKRRQGSVVLVVEDDGKGFDPQEVLASRPKDKRLGLYGMEERASLVGGRLTVESQPGAGTIISVDIPLEVTWTVRETTE